MICSILCSLMSGCQTVPTREEYVPPQPVKTKPIYEFQIIQTEDGQMACLNSIDTQKLFTEIKECRGTR